VTLLSLQQVAERLGLAPRTIENQLHDHRHGSRSTPLARLGWVRVGRAPRLPEAELARYVQEAALEAPEGPQGSPGAELLQVAARVEHLFPQDADVLRALAARLRMATGREPGSNPRETATGPHLVAVPVDGGEP